jgi:Ca2+-transporting ATPase
MGGADEIVTDKTGTLTTNVMTVRGLYTMNEMYIEKSKFDNLKLSHLENRELITEGVLYNCSAYVQTNKDKRKEEVIGNPTESGVLRFFIDHSMDIDHILKSKEKII